MEIKECVKKIHYFKWIDEEVENEKFNIKLFKNTDRNISITQNFDDTIIKLKSHHYCPKCGYLVEDHGFLKPKNKPLITNDKFGLKICPYNIVVNYDEISDDLDCGYRVLTEEEFNNNFKIIKDL